MHRDADGLTIWSGLVNGSICWANRLERSWFERQTGLFWFEWIFETAPNRKPLVKPFGLGICDLFYSDNNHRIFRNSEKQKSKVPFLTHIARTTCTNGSHLEQSNIGICCWMTNKIASPSGEAAFISSASLPRDRLPASRLKICPAIDIANSPVQLRN